MSSEDRGMQKGAGEGLVRADTDLCSPGEGLERWAVALPRRPVIRGVTQHRAQARGATLDRGSAGTRRAFSCRNTRFKTLSRAGTLFLLACVPGANVQGSQA